MEKFEVKDVQDAVDLAFKFKKEGTYNWFRGQAREWRPFTSLARAQDRGGEPAVIEVRRRVQLFWEWVLGTPQLRHLSAPEHQNKLGAILQHYGVPTHYLDFTTDPGVAGFFAADAPNVSEPGMSCIYCLDTTDLADFWETMQEALEDRRKRRLEIVNVELTNLWRLEAQAGAFLFVNYNWDIDYPMDRIVFPPSGYPAAPTRDRIYPHHKSELEQLLDHFFDLDRRDSTELLLRGWFEEARAKGRTNILWATAEDYPHGVYAEAFRDGRAPSVVRSWDAEDVNQWQAPLNASFGTTVGTARRVTIPEGATPDQLRAAVDFGVRQSIRSTPNLREFAIEWVLTGSDAALESLLVRVWNGMRLLPYEDTEISQAMGMAALLLKLGASSFDTSKRESLLEGQFGPGQEVEFAMADGGGARAWVPTAVLKAALRADLNDLLLDKYVSTVSEEFARLFQVIHNPKRLFEFSPFRALFVTFCIPLQVVDRRDLIIFNLIQLETFGNP